MKYVAVAAGIVLIVLAAGLVFWAVREKPQQPARPQGTSGQSPKAPARTEKPAASIEAKGVEIERRDETGQLKWKLTASGKMKADREKGLVTAEEVQWRLETPDKIWRARARKAVMKEESNDVALEGGVELESVDGQVKIKATRARYEMKAGRLVMEGPVTLQAGAGDLRADRAVVDLKNKVLRAANVRGYVAF